MGTGVTSRIVGHWDEIHPVGSMLVDCDGIAYPCPELQMEAAAALPVIQLPASEANPIKPGEPIPKWEQE